MHRLRFHRVIAGAGGSDVLGLSSSASGNVGRSNVTLPSSLESLLVLSTMVLACLFLFVQGDYFL
jgi:hypothetical protein